MIKLQISRTDKHEDQTESRILIFGKCTIAKFGRYVTKC